MVLVGAARVNGVWTGRQAGYTAVPVDVGIRVHQLPADAPPIAASRDPEEEQLVASLARGDARALEALYERHGRAVYSMALHLLGDVGSAEEVVQETFLKLWRRPEAYQAHRGRLLGWLLGVAHHGAVDLLRRRRLEQRHRASTTAFDAAPGDNQANIDVAGPDHDDPVEHVTAGERARVVVGALAGLPPNQRIPLELAYYRGLTQSEIARTLDEPLGTIKTRMRLGLQRLREAPGVAGVWEGHTR